MTRPSAARTTDYPAFPDVVAQIGEDPARFLSDETGLDPKPRIHAIYDKDVLDLWFQVEEQLGPRPEVMKELNWQRRCIDESRPGESYYRWRRRIETENDEQPAVNSDSEQAVATDGGTGR